MNAPIDTLAFAKSFEEAGFGHDQARALAAALGKTHEASREDIVTRDVLRAELADFRVELKGEMAELRSELRAEMAELRSELKGEMAELRSELKGEMAELRSDLKSEMAESRSELRAEMAKHRSELKDDLADLKLALVREIASVGKDVSGRLWSTVTIIAGVSTAISAVVGAAVALLLHAKAF